MRYKVRWAMTKLQSKHAENNGTKNSLDVKLANNKMKTSKSNSKRKQLASAGTIPIRRRGNEFELCLVTSRRCKNRFVFPKGKVAQNEKLKQTAVRETTEEAGVSGELVDYPIIHRVKGLGNNSGGKTVCFYPILVDTEMKRWPERFIRQRKWVSLNKLKKKKKYRHLRELLSALENAKPKQKKKIFKRLRQTIA